MEDHAAFDDSALVLHRPKAARIVQNCKPCLQYTKTPFDVLSCSFLNFYKMLFEIKLVNPLKLTETIPTTYLHLGFQWICNRFDEDGKVGIDAVCQKIR